MNNWTVCHIWGIDDPTFQRRNVIVQDPQYYSNVGNMVLLPSPIKAFTDCVPEIKLHLRVCAWYLYGFICDEESVKDEHSIMAEAERIRNGYIPEGYPDEWPRKHREKLPPGTVRYNSRIQKYISDRKAQIKNDLKDPLLEGTNYPKDSILSVLNKFPGNVSRWWEV